MAIRLSCRMSCSLNRNDRSLSLYAAEASGSLRLGVYDATGPAAAPHSEAQSNAFTPVVEWKYGERCHAGVPCAGNYWLAYFASSNSSHYATNFRLGRIRRAIVAFWRNARRVPPPSHTVAQTHWSSMER